MLPFLTLLLPTFQPNPNLADTTILIIRHAEKPADGDTLTAAGEARAKAYASYFTHLKVDGHKWKTSHLFATADSKHSERPRLTVTPLSQAIGMEIDNRFKDKNVEGIAGDIEAHNYGKDILICWHHGQIPNLISALGANPAPLFPTGKWPGETFDWMVEIPFDHQGVVKTTGVRIIHEHLMPGDAK